MIKERHLALAAAFTASAIYGINHSIAKDIMPTYIKPFGFILLRVIGAAILFWIIGSLFGPKEHVERKDWLRFVLCAIFGMAINMLFFFKGLSLSTPINSSVLITISPIIIFVLGVIFLKEKITSFKIVGIFLGFTGALGLVLFNAEIRLNAPNIPLGNVFLLINAFSYAIYLILVKPLTSKYHVFTLMKWLFLIGVIINLPITIAEFTEIRWVELPAPIILKLVFVVVGVTFLTYLLNIYALKQLNASTLGVFIYLQPLLGILFAILIGSDTLNAVQTIASVFVLVGVYLVTLKPKKQIV